MLEETFDVIGPGPWCVEFRLNSASSIEDLFYRTGLQACQVILCS